MAAIGRPPPDLLPVLDELGISRPGAPRADGSATSSRRPEVVLLFPSGRPESPGDSRPDGPDAEIVLEVPPGILAAGSVGFRNFLEAV
jgi:hypothetical protein